MTHFRYSPPARVLLCLVFLLCGDFVTGSVPNVLASDQDELGEMRARRRSAMRSVTLAADKTDGPVLFGLLVIPVDFADARLPDTWNSNALTSRLTSGTGESLHQYFSAASAGRLDLRITQTPLIHLPGTRRDYSDIGLNLFTRTRALATESLEAIRDLGFEFRRLDMDGPDRVPGTDDDDGEVDGILILHAGIGQENDAVEGLVQALQFFLDEPVVSQGISATFYAVASLQSGPGIWAHETAHLLGLEDRYDPGLRPAGASEVRSLGGLGRFSLMASGAWGTGGGFGAALPDAYSCLQLGWYSERNLGNGEGIPDTLFSGLVSGHVDRLWTRGEPGPEYFLLETRNPAAAFPFDANVPADNLLIYHVDETVPEGQQVADGIDSWHLKVSLVEADDDFKLRRGEDDGRAEDQFPGPLEIFDFGPATTPSSQGYREASGVFLNDISSIPGGVTFQTTVWSDEYLDMFLGFSGQTEVFMDLVAQSTGVPFANLNCLVSVPVHPTWGTFAGGQLSVSFEMEDDGQGRWRPVEPVIWIPDPDVPSDARTTFTFDFQFDGGAESENRIWYWKDNGGVLDFETNWPGMWIIEAPGNINTLWHRWNGAPWLTADGMPVLACTGQEYSDSSDWPVVNYQNSASIHLTSGPLGQEVRAVRLIHGLEVEILTAGVAMDGGVVSWVDSRGRIVPAEPLAGWDGRISDQALNELHGQNALLQEDLELDGDIPLWRNDVFPVPEGLPGPWRLRLSFGSNTLWRFKGWFVAGVDPIVTVPAAAAFEATWNREGNSQLAWTWPWDRNGLQRFIIQHRDGPDSGWRVIVDEDFPAPTEAFHVLPGDRILPYLEGPARQRHELRVIGFFAKGRVATRNVVVFPDGGDGSSVTLGRPWPNPANDSVRFLVDIPAGSEAKLGIFDLRGRRILERSLVGGSRLLEWDGRGQRGGRAPSGTYIIRLEGSGPAIMRKVVLLH